MKSGICPKCGSHEIYAKKEKKTTFAPNRILIDARHVAVPEHYICVDCGYVEKYISNGFDTIKMKWKKISL